MPVARWAIDHYENLGLVELLRRGCTEIYCLDASGLSADGAEFESLGEAITLARSELGVEIEFAGEEGGKRDLAGGHGPETRDALRQKRRRHGDDQITVDREADDEEREGAGDRQAGLRAQRD